MVVDARAFAASSTRTVLKEHQTNLADLIALALLLTLILGVSVLLIFHIGNRQI